MANSLSTHKGSHLRKRREEDENEERREEEQGKEMKKMPCLWAFSPPKIREGSLAILKRF